MNQDPHPQDPHPATTTPVPGAVVSRVLLVDENTERAALVTDMLKASGVQEVFRFDAAHDLLDKVLQIKPDLVLVEVDSPKRDTLEQLTGIAHRLPVMLVAKDRSPQAIRAAVASGVSSYVIDGMSADAVQPAIDVAAATFQRFTGLRQELDQAKAQIEDRRSIEEAKSLLIQRHGYDEPAAYRALQKLAMDSNRRLIDIARDVKRFAAVLSPPTS